METVKEDVVVALLEDYEMDTEHPDSRPACFGDLRNLELSQNEHIEGVEARLNKKIDETAERLDKKIDAVEERLTKRIDIVEIRLIARINDVENRLTTRMDSVDTKLDQLLVAANKEAGKREYAATIIARVWDVLKIGIGAVGGLFASRYL